MTIIPKEGEKMSSKRAVWLAFFLNLSFAIVEFIAGGIFGSSAVLADSVHDLGDALAIGLSAILETISNRQEDSRYTLGYKRFSLLGAILTAVILITGSTLVILENISKFIEPQPVDHEGMLWLGVIAIIINLTASLIVRKGQTKNESILSLHFLEDTLGWLAVIVVAIILRYTDWYFLDPLLSLGISAFILSQALPRFWSTLKIFLDAVPEGVDIKQVKNDLEQLDNVASINQLNLWTMDGLEKNAIVHVCLKRMEHMEVCKEAIRTLLKEGGFQNVTIEVDEDLATHRSHKRNIEELEASQSHGHDHHHHH
jgi:cation diffusion facilitator family transporter